MQRVRDLGIRYIHLIYVFIFVAMLIAIGCRNERCGRFIVELEKDDISVCMDTALLNLKSDSLHTYLKQKPYIIKLVSKTNDVVVYMYIGGQDEIMRLLDVYDMEEKYGLIEDQFKNKAWIKYIGKDKIYKNNSIIYFVEYFVGNSNWIQVQMTNNDSMFCRILVINNDPQMANHEYVNTVKAFINTICFIE